MKLNYKSVLTATTLMVAAANANAGMVFDWYVGATAGLGGQTFTIDDDHFSDSAKSFGAIAGVDIPFVRIEAEYNNLDGKNVDIQMGALNAYVKLPGLVIINPYIGAGVGMVFNVDVDKTAYSIGDYDESGKAVFQGMLGATFNIPALPFKIDVEGRMMYAPKLIDITAIDDSAAGMQYDARVKLRYIF